MTIVIKEVSILSDDARQLIALLDAELDSLYPVEHRHIVDFSTFHQNGGHFVVAYDDGAAVGCGGLRPFESSVIELKRMFVVEQYRGRGISRLILGFLESLAKQLGNDTLVLETGDKQLAAISLYQQCCYERVEPFGEYIKSSASICFRKRIGDHSAS